MDVFSVCRDRIAVALSQVLPDQDIDTASVVVEPPRDESHGDLATNVALVHAKLAGLKPRDLAERVGAQLVKDDIEHGHIASVDVAGPGFINLTLTPAFWTMALAAILDSGERYGRTYAGGGAAVNVEYVSANPTGPLHVGHCRGAVFGDALANLLQATGHEVTREYYVNDAGAQVDVLARSAFLRYREALGETGIEIPDGLYPGDYLKPVGQALADAHGRELLDRPESEWLPVVRETAISMMMDLVRSDLAALGISHDVFSSERALISGDDDVVGATIADLRDRGLIYQGRLEPPKGKTPEDWEDREQTLFRATEFGDDVDRPLIKSDGSYTYFAPDIAYHRDKYLRGFKSQIDVLGADHSGYVKRLTAAVAAVSGGEASLVVKICQMVRLFRGGEPVRMSKRAGEFVTLRDVVDEVGKDVVRFMMLTRKNEAPLDFDFVTVTEQSKDNPVFYVQYAHARAHSVFRNARDVFPDLEPLSAGALLGAGQAFADEADLSLIRKLCAFPRIVGQAAKAHEPHRIAFYLYDVASSFHALWNRGKDTPQLRFIHGDDEALTQFRVTLVATVATVIGNGLRILGVTPVEEMR